MPEERIVGKPLPRIDASEKVTGEAIFAADVQLPRILFAKLLMSPHAHAEILSINASRAEALKGVHAVVTGADIPEVDTFDPDLRLHAFLARRFAVFEGQTVAAVAAENITTAETALDLIEVEYRPLPVVTTLQEAIKPSSPVVSREPKKRRDEASGDQSTEEQSSALEKRSSNVVNRQVVEHGDLAAAFKESAVIVEHTYTVPRVHQGYIEPHAVTAFWDRENHVTVWECAQGAFEVRDLIANTLGIPRSSITVNLTEIGGGFGGKSPGVFAPLAVLLAKKAHRPVKLVLTRREELIGAIPAPHLAIRLKTGAAADGTLTALEGQILCDVGAFTDWGVAMAPVFLIHDNYRFQAWRLEALEVLTNKASYGSYRAPLAAHSCFAIESQIDELAVKLKIDPLDLRMKNAIVKGDPLVNLTPQVDVGAREVLRALADHPAWRSPPPTRIGDDGLLHGRGLGLGSWGGARGPAAASIILDAEDRFRVVIGTVDLTGSFTSLAQIAAEALSVSTHQILMSKSNPDLGPFAPISGGSQTVYAMGAAVKEAALDLRAKLLACAAQELKVPQGELSINEHGVFVESRPDQSCSFQLLYDLGTSWLAAKYGPLVGHGSAPRRQRAPAFAASVAEVAVDPETGQVTLKRMTTAQDVGRAINPLSVEGQIQGGAAQSAGMALWEEILYDENGHVLNPSLLDYHMPTALDVPMIETILVNVPAGDGPYGAKVVGEPPMIPPIAALANAVAAAIGTRIYDLPITPERIWQALNGRT
jgi:CO/xanthine dehydrogenase Mo-binding subunit